MLKTILVPTDGSPLADRALPYATTLARNVGGRVVLVRAALAHARPGMDELAAQMTATQQAEYDLAAMAERLEKDGISVERSVYYDEAAAAITDAVERREADLVLMSTHGRTGLGRWIYGSVADRVLRHTDVPVLLVPAGCERTWADDRKPRILVPLDGSELAMEALAPADELADVLGAELLLLGVLLPPLPTVTDDIQYAHGFDEKAALAGARQYLETIAGGLRQGGRAVDTAVVVGYPPAAIAAVAREAEADVIAMATHGRGGLARLVMGSVATGVLQRTTAPLLLVRPSAVRHAAKPATRPAAAPGTVVSVGLSPRELELVERGLEELLQNLGPDHHPAAAAADLLARLKQAASVAAGQPS